MTTSGPPIRWLVAGAGGVVGHDLVRVLRERAAAGADTVAAYTRADLDITEADVVDVAVGECDVVLNAAGWTDVDGAEAAEDAAYAANALGPETLALACARHGARLVHLSTDYVFDGAARTPYDEDAPTGPRSAYGRTKLAGERAVLAASADAIVVRTSWVYGEHGKSFVATMLNLARGDRAVDVVDDQVGSPTWSDDLARALVAVGASAPAPGIYHATNTGAVTWWGLARAVFAAAGADPERVHPTTSTAYPRPAPRPAYSVLGSRRWAAAGLPPMRPWPDALADCLPRLLAAQG